MKNIILQIMAILCTFAGIYFDRTLPIIGGILLFFAYDYMNNYYKDPEINNHEDLKINTYIQIFLILTQAGLMTYVAYDLLKSSLASVNELLELLGTKPDFLNYILSFVILFAFYFALSTISRKFLNILQKYIN
jgi:uncharacterized membrane protein